MNDVLTMILVVLLVVLVAGLSIAEAALTSISRARAGALAEDEGNGAEVLVRILQDRRRSLAPILLLALAAQLSAGALLAVMVNNRAGSGWAIASVAGLLAVMFVIAESVPKHWAITHVDRAAVPAARAANLLSRIHPVRWLVNLLIGIAGLFHKRGPARPSPVASEEEIVALAGAAVAADVLEDSEGLIIQSLVHFGDTLVREAMVPRPDVLSVSSDTTIDHAIAMLVERGVSRMPVFGDDIDDIRGVVHIKDLFSRVQRGRGSHFVSIAMRPPYFVPESKRASELMGELQGQPVSMVIAIDEYGGMAGIVTMEDLIEEILGDIVDEFDAAEEPKLEPLRVGEWRVHGRMPVDEFNELIGADLPDDDWDTVGGLIFDSLGHVPEVGEAVVESGYQLMVEQVEGRRITRVRVVVAEPSELAE